LDRDKVIFVAGVAVFSFALGWAVDEFMFNHSLKTHMSKEATIYLAAMDYVRAIRNGEE